MSPENTTFETVEEFLDALPEVPCSEKLGEPFCSLCERVNRRVARACKHSRIYAGEEATTPTPGGEVAEKREVSVKEAAEDLKLRKVIKERGLPEIEIVPPGGEVIEMQVEGGEVVFRKAGEAEIEFARLKRRAQEELVSVQKLLGNMKVLGYGLENLKDNIKKMADDFREREYERVIERAEELKENVLREEYMSSLKDSLAALVQSLQSGGGEGKAGEILKVALELYDGGDYPSFIEKAVELIKEYERVTGSRIVIGVPLTKPEEKKPVKKVIKKSIDLEAGEEKAPERTAPEKTMKIEEIGESERFEKGEIENVEAKKLPPTPKAAVKKKKVVKKVSPKRDKITEVVEEAYRSLEEKRREGKDVSQILELLALVDQKRREGDEEFAMKLAAQSLEMTKRL